MELKARTAQEIVRNENDCDYMDELFGGVKMPPTEVYFKAEADKYIEELEEKHKMEVEQLLLEIAQVKRAAQTLRKKMNHWKRKWCLAMEKWCRAREGWYSEKSQIFGIEWSWKEKRCLKWRRRWLELAEKFKEGK